ncbi:MAG: hypothetical protein QM487_14800 [Candidatus Marithrix sp.]
MRKYLLITIFILTKVAFAEGLSTVKIGNIGDDYTNLIIKAIDKNLQEYGYTAISEVAISHQENINKLISGKISTAFIPLDIAATNLINDPKEKLLLIGGKVVPKVFFCVAYKGSDIKTYADLIANNTVLKIFVGDKNGATDRTFQHLTQLNPKLQNFKLYYESKTKIELNRLLSGRRDLVCFISVPDPNNELIKMVMGHGELLFITINQPDFITAKIGKIRLYDILEIPVSNGFLGFNQKKVKTLVTWLSIVANEEQMEKQLLDSLTSVVMQPDLFLSQSFAYKIKQFFDITIKEIKKIAK